jgi:hypothetical protein
MPKYVMGLCDAKIRISFWPCKGPQKEFLLTSTTSWSFLSKCDPVSVLKDQHILTFEKKLETCMKQ